MKIKDYYLGIGNFFLKMPWKIIEEEEEEEEAVESHPWKPTPPIQITADGHEISMGIHPRDAFGPKAVIINPRHQSIR